jgi:hypothetical protein
MTVKRTWKNFGESRISVELATGEHARRLAVELMVGGEYAFLLNIAIPFLFSIWFGLYSWRMSRMLRLPYESRTTGFYISKELSHLQIWNDDSEWTRKSRSWSVLNENLFFGRSHFKKEPLQTIEGFIPMPEKDYPATFEISRDTWTWKRFKKPLTLVRVMVNIPEGIPHPGKGTSSWNLDDDALFGMGCAVESVETAVSEATQKVIASVNYCREHYPL